MAIPEAYQEFPGAVNMLKNAFYGTVLAGRCWNNKIVQELESMGFEESPAIPCLLRQVVDDEAVMTIVIHMDDLLITTKTKERIDESVKVLGSRVKITNLGETKYYMNCHISRDRTASKLDMD